MAHAGRPAQLIERSLGTLKHSRVNRTPRKVFVIKGPGYSLRETSRKFRREVVYTLKIDVRKMEVPERKDQLYGKNHCSGMIMPPKFKRLLSVNSCWPDVPK